MRVACRFGSNDCCKSVKFAASSRFPAGVADYSLCLTLPFNLSSLSMIYKGESQRIAVMDKIYESTTILTQGKQVVQNCLDPAESFCKGSC